jgi:hypothetical protein
VKEKKTARLPGKLQTETETWQRISPAMASALQAT